MKNEVITFNLSLAEANQHEQPAITIYFNWATVLLLSKGMMHGGRQIDMQCGEGVFGCSTCAVDWVMPVVVN